MVHQQRASTFLLRGNFSRVCLAINLRLCFEIPKSDFKFHNNAPETTSSKVSRAQEAARFPGSRGFKYFFFLLAFCPVLSETVLPSLLTLLKFEQFETDTMACFNYHTSSHVNVQVVVVVIPCGMEDKIFWLSLSPGWLKRYGLT